ncbi:MAG TPA: Hsp20/alpha crystallin family protein [Verrucomicrobiae bacterium]|nr:Hsp20/alpha crystallin family protein [Verrucomicrobiae bacterium]
MAKDKNLINKLMGTQTMQQDDEEMQDEQDMVEGTETQSSQEDWLSEYEGQLTIDMYQTKDNVVIKSTIAGVKPEDIDVTIANDMVTIRGERRRDFEASAEDYFYQECYWGSFSRSVVLPVDVDIENVAADLKDGILTVVLPKAAKARAKKIRVGGGM